MVINSIRNPRTAVSSGWQTFRHCLFEPDRFFEDGVGGRGLRSEAIVVLVIGIAGSIGVAFAINELLAPFEAAGQLAGDGPTLQQMSIYQIWARSAFPIVTAFLLWLLYTTAFFLGSWLFSGRGTFFSLLKHSAWGLVPLLFANLIETVALVVTFWNFEVETERVTQSTNVDQQIALLTEQGFTEPLVLGASLLTIAFLAWCWYIWTYAIAAAQDIDRSRTKQIAAVPVVVHAAYIAWNVVQSAGIL